MRTAQGRDSKKRRLGMCVMVMPYVNKALGRCIGRFTLTCNKCCAQSATLEWAFCPDHLAAFHSSDVQKFSIFWNFSESPG